MIGGHARLEDMDLDGIDAEVLYFGGPVTQYPSDPELRVFIAQTYNDWMVELSEAAPDRLIGLGHMPLVDVGEATAALTRIATRPSSRSCRSRSPRSWRR